MILAVAADRACHAAVGAIATLKHRRWLQSRCLSVAVGADGDASARRTIATLQLVERSQRFSSHHPATL
nr:hypothetical protein CFP56_16019 [Quercus suber]